MHFKANIQKNSNFFKFVVVMFSEMYRMNGWQHMEKVPSKGYREMLKFLNFKTKKCIQTFHYIKDII